MNESGQESAITVVKRLGIQFAHMFDELARVNHTMQHTKGFWENRNALIELAHKLSPELGTFAEKAITGLNIALIHSELSEGLEGLRKNLKDDHIPEFTMEEAEYADAIIRIMDIAGKKKLRVGHAIIAKMIMNHGRPRLHGGKAF